MHKLKTALIGGLLGAAVFATNPATAMPVGELTAASKALTRETQKVVWICRWYECWWTPAFSYPAPYYYRSGRWWGRPYGAWRHWWW